MPASDLARLQEVFRPAGFENALVVLGAGFVHIRKGVDLFLACAAAVAAARPRRPVRFIWIGDGYDAVNDPSYSSYLGEQIERSGLTDTVAIIDAIPDIDSAYALTDVFFLSSRLDPMPNVTIDSAFHGTPVVCFEGASGMAALLAKGARIATVRRASPRRSRGRESHRRARQRRAGARTARRRDAPIRRDELRHGRVRPAHRRARPQRLRGHAPARGGFRDDSRRSPVRRGRVLPSERACGVARGGDPAVPRSLGHRAHQPQAGAGFILPPARRGIPSANLCPRECRSLRYSSRESTRALHPQRQTRWSVAARGGRPGRARRSTAGAAGRGTARTFLLPRARRRPFAEARRPADRASIFCSAPRRVPRNGGCARRPGATRAAKSLSVWSRTEGATSGRSWRGSTT